MNFVRARKNLTATESILESITYSDFIDQVFSYRTFGQVVMGKDFGTTGTFPKYI